MSNKPNLTGEDLTFRIIFNREACEKLDAFVERLDQQGVLRLFMDSTEVDKFVEIIKAKHVLDGGFEHIDAASAYIIRDFQSELRIHVGNTLAHNKVTEDSQILPEVTKIIQFLEDPKHARHLFQVLKTMSDKYIYAYGEALHAYRGHKLLDLLLSQETSDGEFKLQALNEEFALLLTHLGLAFPSGSAAGLNRTEWMNKHSRMLSKVSFTPVLKCTCFENLYEELRATGYFLGYSKVHVEKQLNDYFQNLILDDILSTLPENKRLSSELLNKAIQELATTRPFYVSMRYIQTGFIALAKEKEKFVAVPPSNPSFGGRFNNIPS